MGLLDRFAKQFEKPEGYLGALAGKLMEMFGYKKIEWTISLLDLQKEDNVLEVGFGPGIGIELAANAIQDGYIVGVDYSEKMLKQAQKRNKKHMEEGKVELRLADVSDLPIFDLPFDKVFSVNSIIFWKEPTETLKAIRQRMKQNGIVAITVQPFEKGATEETVKQIGNKIANQLKDAGFSSIRMEIISTKPVSTVCVLGINQ
ncbi:class I SAM-dependent methyltransferase [Virgibacillus senegalensis]|uniref:class I SAM-dependent methyltransferase n=1 Tax=Virgibacillus senegalensis TaxID=1499679 RepID=UPI00069FAAAB|nr:class I SAM-dependent methyltransferase [Virgibacillus senegalensis]